MKKQENEKIPCLSLPDAGANMPDARPRATYDAAAATPIAAADFFREAKAGHTYSVNDGPVALAADGAVYDGQGATLIAAQGVCLTGTGMTLCHLTVIGSLSVTAGENITLSDVTVVSEETAISVSQSCRAVRILACHLYGRTALANAGEESTVLDSDLSFTEAGITDTAVCGTAVQNCTLTGHGTGITSGAADLSVRFCTVKEAEAAIVLTQGAANALLAQNDLHGDITVCGADNTAVVRNRLRTVTANGNRHLYIIDNLLEGLLEAHDNNYFIADGNACRERGKAPRILQSGNENHNGDSITDVNARLPVGADEALLPHSDKDQFVGRPRRDTVRDVTVPPAAQKPLSDYILTAAAQDEVVIVPPGAYRNDATLAMTDAHSHTTVYAYGVYMERQKDLGPLADFSDCTGITLKGITMGYVHQSCGQVYVLEKLPDDRLLTVTGAGMENKFENNGVGAQRAGTFYAYCDTSYLSAEPGEVIEGIETVVLTVRPDVYETVAVGDILTSRLSNGGTAIRSYRTTDQTFHDLTLYGSAAGLAFLEIEAYTAVSYYRVYNTTQNGVPIGEDLFRRYQKIGAKFGVDLEVSVDACGRHRGSPAHIGSIDATHVVACAQGSHATSCIFENMCDDATNQHANHGRLAEVRDLHDGTTVLVYKPNLAEVTYRRGVRTPRGNTRPFKVGQRVYVYSSKGRLVCDTPALTATTEAGTRKNSLVDEEVPHYAVTVRTEDVNFAALSGFDLTQDGPEAANKVLIDNMDMASNHFIFDNSKFGNIRSRGLLIKASNGVIRNCTFRNIGMSCGAVLYEIFWGESGVTEHLLIDRNLFDHTGYFRNQDLYATVSITGLGSEVDEDYLLYKDIVISNNVMRGRTTDYAVYVNSAKNVRILNNTFEPFVGNDFTNHKEAPESAENKKPAIHIFAAMDIEISGNTYARSDWTVADTIHTEKAVHVFGTDVE